MEIKDMEQLKYKQLLDLEWIITRTTTSAQAKYDKYYAAYGKEELLTELAYKELKELRAAKQILTNVEQVLRDNDLYTYGD